ncbi:DNA-binding MarR family transcriptional regulator [Pseudoduganella lurida]|uniref:DNA-binding MarR family transcriptional regulator n=1 Tax=Pseudoduganella lurida TaxID=1036180 RepID=A0A562QXE8_9BURK|nr:MarR family transcriptional regulator [Pseudoduganella lurida]TWI60890.1 DNA-binding MarR family transcriptional regulator [Pseudoduganella lurida]
MQAFEELKNVQFGYLISQARNALYASLDREMLPLDLTASQFIVVIGAMRERARTVNEFCRLAGIAPGPMSRLLDRMEAKGIVRRERDRQDARQVHVTLTEKGVALYPQINAGLQKVYGQLLNGFSEDEASTLKYALEKILLNARG